MTQELQIREIMVTQLRGRHNQVFVSIVYVGGAGWGIQSAYMHDGIPLVRGPEGMPQEILKNYISSSKIEFVMFLQM